MKKVVVTGASGFIGSAICKELVNRGIYVIAVVHNKAEALSEIANNNKLQIIYSELNNFRNLADIITDSDIDVLYHFAWTGSAGLMRGDIDVQMNNVKCTCDIIRACAEIGCKRFVFASSIMEYEIEATMKSEVTPNISTLYCSAKVAADYMSRTIAGDLGIDYIRAVISNIYGPGEMNPRLINTSLRKMLKGEHCSFSSGNQLYDFVYISDATKAFFEIGEKGVSNRTYYIGSSNPKPLKEFLMEMRDCVDPDIKLGIGELPFNGISLTYKEFDVNAVNKDTGFINEVSFKEGINKTIRWLKESM